MPELLKYYDKIILYVNRNNELSHKLISDKPLYACDIGIINDLSKYKFVNKIFKVFESIFVLKLDGSLEVVYDPKNNLSDVLLACQTKTVKNIFSEFNEFKNAYIQSILFNDNSIIIFSNSLRTEKLTEMSIDPNYCQNVLCVDFVDSSIQILKLDSTKIIITHCNTTIIEDCIDSRLLECSYI